MNPRFGISGLFAASAVFSMLPLGCGAAQDDYTLVAPSHESQIADERPPNDVPAEAQKQMQACFAQHKGPWSHHRYAVRYQANTNNDGGLSDVKLQETTLEDPIEACVRGVIASLKVPESVLRTRRSGPVSGGERLTREQRGSLGSNDSQNPLVWVFFVVLESVEIEVTIQVLVGAIAAVGTIATSTKKDPDQECYDKFEACQDTPLGKIEGNVRGTSVCATCFDKCRREGGWPSGFKRTRTWQSCL
jgi:hypothetical protein